MLALTFPSTEFCVPLNLQPLVNASIAEGSTPRPPQHLYLMRSIIWGCTSYHVSQAVSASKLLKPLLSHSCLPPTWKRTVYRSIVLSILTYAMDTVLLTSPQIRKPDAIHYKSLRRIFKIESSFIVPKCIGAFSSTVLQAVFGFCGLPNP